MAEMFTATDPTTGLVVREVPTLDAAELRDVLQRAEDAYDGWRRWSIEDRAGVLRAIAAAMR
ncbi:MAG: aldehyde dehydrogenase family protein, partial [Microbacterium gubbeenense]